MPDVIFVSERDLTESEVAEMLSGVLLPGKYVAHRIAEVEVPPVILLPRKVKPLGAITVYELRVSNRASPPEMDVLSLDAFYTVYNKGPVLLVRKQDVEVVK